MTEEAAPAAPEPAERPLRERILAYDMLRIVAAVSVVAIHVLAAHLSQRSAAPDPDWARVTSHALHYAVPIFTFLSGALAWGAPWRGGPGALLVLYLFTPLASRAFDRAPELALAAAVAVRVLGTGPIASLIDRMPYYNAYEPLLTNVIEFLPFMALGAWFAVRRERVVPALKLLALPLAGVGLWLSAVTTLDAITLPDTRLVYLAHTVQVSAIVLGLTGAAFALASSARFTEGGPASRQVLAFSTLTFGAYLAHPLVLFAVRRLAGLLPFTRPYDSPAFMAGLGVVVLAASFGVTAALKRTKAGDAVV